MKRRDEGDEGSLSGAVSPALNLCVFWRRDFQGLGQPSYPPTFPAFKQLADQFWQDQSEFALGAEARRSSRGLRDGFAAQVGLVLADLVTPFLLYKQQSVEGELSCERILETVESGEWRGYSAHVSELVDILLQQGCGLLQDVVRSWQADQAHIEEVFSVGIGQAQQVELWCSDRHLGGRAVCMLHGTSGSIVFKPRSLLPELRYNALLTWINDQGFEFPLQTLKVSCEGGYGWMEHASTSSGNPRGVDSFWEQIGALTALWLLLDGTDLHMANLLVANGAPVVVDVETLFQTYRGRQDGVPTLSQLGLLPSPALVDGYQVDYSGVGAPLVQSTGFRVPRYEELDPAMERSQRTWASIVYEPAELHAAKMSVPVWLQENDPLRLDRAEAGFLAMLAFLRSRALELNSIKNPIHVLAETRFRKLSQRTRQFAYALNCSCEPSIIGDLEHRRQAAATSLGVPQEHPYVSEIIGLDIPYEVNQDSCGNREEVARRLALIDSCADGWVSELRVKLVGILLAK